MQKKVKVFDFGTGRLFAWTGIPYVAVTDPLKADIIIFPGGSDIHPRLYGQNMGRRTYANLSADERQVAVYKQCVGKVPMFGICRGMQLLSALNGAFLVQDMNHPSIHTMYTKGGDSFPTNSLHHQQVCLTKLPKENYILLGWTTKLSPYHYSGRDVDYKFSHKYKEPEAVYFPKTRSLGVQYHPEMSFSNNETALDWTRTQIQKYLLND